MKHLSDPHGVIRTSTGSAPWPQSARNRRMDRALLGRIEPISRRFGYDRGVCIDRYYIERFLCEHAQDIRGHVLEIGDDRYTRQFGGDRVLRSDVVHVLDGNPKATLVGDLTDRKSIASDAFDCVILTQTLQHIYDIQAVVQTVYDLLNPQGIVLCTVPGISQISRYDMDRWGDYWRFTSLSLRRLWEETFDPQSIKVEAFGNVMAAVAFLHGLAVEDVDVLKLDAHDPDYELLLTVRACKTG